MSAADRIAEIDRLPTTELCARAEELLKHVVDLMNEETTLLRAGNYRQAEPVTAQKASAAQSYVVVARAVQRAASRIQAEAPELYARLRLQHESFATQMAENLRVIATAKSLTQMLLTDIAEQTRPKTRTDAYGTNGTIAAPARQAAHGLSLNKSL